MMKTFLVVNPYSANGATGKRWAELSTQVQQALGDYGHAFTQGPMDAARLARQALHDGYECVVAVGGDGTLNEVTNGFFEDGKPVNPKAALGVVPRGTGGDFRRTFDWDSQLVPALHRLRTDTTEPFDVGLLEFEDLEGRPQRRYFANIASFGVSGLVSREVNNGTKALGGKASFMLGTVKGLLKYKDRPVRLRLDDGPWETFDVTAVAVANGRFFGGGMCVAPKALTNDGLFDVTIWSGYGIGTFAFKSHAAYSGAHVSWKGTTLRRCRTLEAQADAETLVDVDGESPGRLPFRATVLPAAIRLKV